MTMKADGDFTLRLKKNLISRHKLSQKLKKPFEKIPFLRGIVRIVGGNYLMMLLAIILLAGELSGFFDSSSSAYARSPLSNTIDEVLGICSLVLLLFLAGKALWHPLRTFQFHGAEHKTIDAFQKRTLTLEGVKNASRIARRCGTEMVVFLIPLMLLFSWFFESALLSMFLAFAVAYEIFNWQKSDKLPVLSWFFKLGYFIQKHIVTREPTEAQMRAALAALFALLEAERTGISIQQPKRTLSADPDKKNI